jgi:hypothetical protein
MTVAAFVSVALDMELVEVIAPPKNGPHAVCEGILKLHVIGEPTDRVPAQRDISIGNLKIRNPYVQTEKIVIS